MTDPTPPRPTEQEPWPALVTYDGWAGRTKEEVLVIGDTPKRYRVKYLHAGFVGGNRRHEVGDVGLVPKYAVTFVAPLKEPR